MKCPHCQIDFHDKENRIELGVDIDGFWTIAKRTCPACSRLVLELISSQQLTSRNGLDIFSGDELDRYLVRPKAANRPPPPSSVPPHISQVYKEAAAIIGDSPMASAALSRRCLQSILREKAGVKQGDLSKEIDEVLASNTLPTYLSGAIDAIRNIGNFAAHPIKSTSSGEIVEVEPGEAEWTLDVLDGLFDFYYIQPELLKARKDALDAKLAGAGKPPVK